MTLGTTSLGKHHYDQYMQDTERDNVSEALLYTYCHSTSPLPIHLSVLIASDMRLLLYNI